MDLNSITNDKVCSFLASQIRAERLRLGYSQAMMAEKSGIPLRTYKRIESNGMGSIQNFIIILRTFERIMALKLLFPVPNIKPRTTIITRVQKMAENSRQK